MSYYRINHRSEIEASRLQEQFLRRGAGEWHRSLPGYAPTPVISLPGLAERLRLGSITVKDESHRFHLKAFKALGGSYATARVIAKRVAQVPEEITSLDELLEFRDRYSSMELCTATDGNHGRSVAWVASLLGIKSHIYLPAGSATARIDNIRREGAEVKVIDGSYDDTVQRVSVDAERYGWQIISDTGWSGYTEIPGWVIAGYRTLFDEVEEQLEERRLPRPHVVLVQSGVGALAAAAILFYRSLQKDYAVRIINVEPIGADCLLQSAGSVDRQRVSLNHQAQTIMAGLNCGTPSLVAWPPILNGVDLFLAIDDKWAVEGMRRLRYPFGSDPPIEAGESGVAGLAGLLALMADDSLFGARNALELKPSTNILIINTEGATDPDAYLRFTAGPPSLVT